MVTNSRSFSVLDVAGNPIGHVRMRDRGLSFEAAPENDPAEAERLIANLDFAVSVGAERGPYFIKKAGKHIRAAKFVKIDDSGFFDTLAKQLRRDRFSVFE